MYTNHLLHKTRKNPKNNTLKNMAFNYVIPYEG
jgi:hypothetical protein